MELFIYILATFRIASLIAQERGPWDVFGRLRHLCGVRYDDAGQPHATNVVADGLTCVWCNSLWVALGWLAVRLLLPKRAKRIAFPFALSSGALTLFEVLEWLEQTRPRS
ncbi:MAG: DUF1360 domain-containing protein [Gemmatimonadales bacterium]|nr:DUF1360 domain-containing protein [Gemmatimonadales bacterium]